jgi:UPF0716 family protein affecting phage T7 exclusion
MANRLLSMTRHFAIIGFGSKGSCMPLLLIGILFALPILDIYATLRFAEALGVPGWAMFIPGVLLGWGLMRRETRTLKSRFIGAVQGLSVNGMVFDSGRRMIAAVLLLLPGFVSDVFALFLLLMPNRSTSPMAAASVGGANNGSTSSQATRKPSVGGASGATVDGEFRRVD